MTNQTLYNSEYPTMMNAIRLKLPRALVAAATLCAVQGAFAHAHPQQLVPAANATVPVTTHQVAIDFDEGLEPAFSSITVTAADGKPATQGKSTVSAANDKHMSVDLAPLAPGAYTVTWVAIALDGHRTEGRYSFNAVAKP
ncbi:MAG TPA: copper resistance protein CopC [Paraburkholderia sp.]|nr:copper resistance protein CopC [Paraburkholderia sp.]